MEIADSSLSVRSPSFMDGGELPIRHTGYSYDVSPAFRLTNIDTEAKSIAIIMDDLDIPFTKNYAHWLIFNIPVMENIPENIPYGAEPEGFGGAIQGRAYGKNRYRGPKIPFFVNGTHRYRFTFYILDSKLALTEKANRAALVRAMKGHIIEETTMTAHFKRPEKVKK